MKPTLAGFLSVFTIGLAASLSPISRPTSVHVALVLVDEGTGRPVTGVVRLRDQRGANLKPESLIPRGWGLDQAEPIGDWFVLPSSTSLELPAEQITIEAVSGIESERSVVTVDLRKDSPNELRIPIRRFGNQGKAGWYSANTHLHLRGLSREESDRYLRTIPSADRLDVLFISHLERAEDDQTYITNEYPIGRLPHLETTGVLISNGEEHRHNFGPQGEGYGHVMLLGIQELVQPVSIGFGISKKHPDWPPIGAGIETARKRGGTAIWCHNNWGYEDVLNWYSGRLHAQNIFDGGSHGGYEDSFYRYLNAGLKVPFSTGTDWFMYDFARCYARIDGALSPESWLAALRAGRTFITNGPMLEFRVGGAGPGETIALESPTEIAVDITAQGRIAFDRLELIQDGRVIESTEARLDGTHFAARLNIKLSVNGPCWLAARINSTHKNEYGNNLFAHTSPVYVSYRGKPVRHEADVRYLLGQLESARSAIAARAQFDTPLQQQEVLDPYDKTITELKEALASHR